MVRIMEKRDLYDIHQKKTNQFYYKNEPVLEDHYYLVVAVMIENSHQQYLIQKRSASKGGKWSLTSGHPKFGETPVEGIITEVYEELGLTIDCKDLILIKNSLMPNKPAFKHLFYCQNDFDISELTLDSVEVEDAKFATKEEIFELIKKGEFHRSHCESFYEFLSWINDKK